MPKKGKKGGKGKKKGKKVVEGPPVITTRDMLRRREMLATGVPGQKGYYGLGEEFVRTNYVEQILEVFLQL